MYSQLNGFIKLNYCYIFMSQENNSNNSLNNSYRTFKNLVLPMVYRLNYGKKTNRYRVFNESNQFADVDALLALEVIQKTGVAKPKKIENKTAKKFNLIEKEKLNLYNPDEKN